MITSSATLYVNRWAIATSTTFRSVHPSAAIISQYMAILWAHTFSYLDQQTCEIKRIVINSKTHSFVLNAGPTMRLCFLHSSPSAENTFVPQRLRRVMRSQDLSCCTVNPRERSTCIFGLPETRPGTGHNSLTDHIYVGGVNRRQAR